MNDPFPAEPRETGAASDPVTSWVLEIQEGREPDLHFERLYKHFHPRLFAYFRHRGLDRERSEELTQDALFNAFDKIARFEHRSHFSTWIFEIVHHLFINELRRAGAAKRDGHELPLAEESPLETDESGPATAVLVSPQSSPYDEMERNERLLALRDGLETLPPKMRSCVLLRLYQDLKYREIAEVMGISVDAVKAHLGQAKQLLQQRLRHGASSLSRLGGNEVDP